MKALKAYDTEAINRFHQRKVHNTEVVEIPQDDPPEPQTLQNILQVFLKDNFPFRAKVNTKQ